MKMYLHFLSHLAEFSLEWEVLQEKHSMLNIFSNGAVYEIMWKNIVE